MIETYKPQFTHKDWIDNQDRVQAGGEDGLNRRFHLLEAEFAGLAEKQINPIIASLGTPTSHLTLTPALVSYTDAGTEVPPWSQRIDTVAKPTGAQQAHGFMNVVLPDGALVQSLLVTGSNLSGTGTLRVALVGVDIRIGGGTGFLVESTTLGTPVEPQSEVKISNDSHRYYLTVDVEGAEADKSVTVFCVQLAYQ
ncbi:hypothetical protein ACFV2S_20665 [Streptomyces sp. NPDC059695]|uniref:hypothetical protein n=1 Tax=Streptomyces sp. NPDC059695 TaxID=3346910 RepID=UPI0036859F1F